MIKEEKKSNLKKTIVPAIETAKQILNSMENVEFKVKNNGNNNHNKYCVVIKNVILVGCLPSQEYAEQIKKDFEALIDKRKRLISRTLETVEKEVSSIVLGVDNKIENAVLGK